MKSTPENIGKTLDRLLARFDSPSPDRMQSAIDRVCESLRLRTDDAPAVARSSSAPILRSRKLSWVAAAAATAFILGASAGGVHMWIWRDNGAHAIVETIDGSLFRGSHAIGIGDRVAVNEIVRTYDGTRAQLILADGSRVEMRSRSELSLEPADDGVRIHLNTGGVIVNAAKQSTGHLYVQTKDVTVSVVGTVFFVNTEEAGSRVAVIQGEVHVQQGSTLKKLFPGEQTTTNPLMESHPVSEEISWSRSATEHLALLQKSTAPTRQTPAGPKVSVRLEFEAVSVKAVEPNPNLLPTPIRCRGIDGELSPASPGSMLPAVPLGRCIGENIPLRSLIAAAYNISVRRVSGVPNYPSDRAIDPYQIEAKTEDPSSATKEGLRQMLQTLLADRFKIEVHRETKETPGFVLSVGKGGTKFKETSGDEEMPAFQPLGTVNETLPENRQLGVRPSMPRVIKGKFRLGMFADFLSLNVPGDLPVIDRTDLPGIYDLTLRLNWIVNATRTVVNGAARFVAGDTEFDPPLSKALEDQLGLHLESAKVPIEYLVVDHVEKPSEN